MQINQVSTLFFSPTATTKKIVESVASAFSGSTAVQHFDVTKNRDQAIPTMGPQDLLILGVPVYGGRIPLLVSQVIEGLRGNGALCIPVVTYGNRAFEDALLELSDLLTAEGFTPAGAGAFICEHSYGRNIASGRPHEKDLKVAQDLGLQVLAKITAADSLSDLAPLKIPGIHPYKDRAPASAPWAPDTLESCNDCGLCPTLCPVQIIDAKNPRLIRDPQLCQHCCACIKGCPQNAKVANAEPYSKIHGFLTASCTAVQKEPELFL